MEFDEVGKYGPSWAKAISDLIASDEVDKALAAAKDAFVRCVSSADVKGKVVALHALAKVHLSRRELQDALEIAERALAELHKSPDETLEGSVMHTIAKASAALYRFQDAEEFAQEALRIFQGAGSRLGEASVLATLAGASLRRDRRQDALKVAKQSLAMFRECGDRDGEAYALQAMAKANMAMRRYEDALRDANQIVGIYEGGGDAADLPRHGAALLVVADVRKAMGEHDDAIEAASKAVELLDGVNRTAQAAATRRLAQACFTKGDDTDGWMYAKEALELYRGEGHLQGEVTMLRDIAAAHFRSATFQEGVLIADEGLRMCREAGIKQQLADLLEVVARARLDQEAMGAGQGQQLNWKARQAAKEALAIYQDLGDLPGQIRAYRALATAFLAYGNVLEGRAKAKSAVELAKTVGDKGAEGASLLLVAQTRFHDNRDEAVRLAGIAQRLLKEDGDQNALKDAEEVLEVIRQDPTKKDKSKKKGGASIAEMQATKADLTMDMDMMRTRAVFFYGFTSRAARPA